MQTRRTFPLINSLDSAKLAATKLNLRIEMTKSLAMSQAIGPDISAVDNLFSASVDHSRSIHFFYSQDANWWIDRNDILFMKNILSIFPKSCGLHIHTQLSPCENIHISISWPFPYAHIIELSSTVHASSVKNVYYFVSERFCHKIQVFCSISRPSSQWKETCIL